MEHNACATWKLTSKKSDSSRSSSSRGCRLKTGKMKAKSSKRSHRSAVKPQRILVPVDFSDSSVRALQYAAERAAESSGSLIIVHVVPADDGWLGIGRDESRDLDRSLQRQAAGRLRAFANQHVGDNMAADLEVRIGQAAEEIIAAANESKCDSIVMSTRGLTGLYPVELAWARGESGESCKHTLHHTERDRCGYTRLVP